MMEQSPDSLRASLSSENADHRFMAAYVAGERRMPWHREFIPLLTDTSDVVRQAGPALPDDRELPGPQSRRGRGVGDRRQDTPPAPSGPTISPVDFGPGSEASPSAQRKAVWLWTEWWAEKRSSAGWVGGLSLVPAEFNADKDIDHLAAPILKAGPVRKAELIALYRDAEGSGYSEALAAATNGTPTDDRVELREALAAHMGRVTEDTLRQRLDSRLPEFRRDCRPRAGASRDFNARRANHGPASRCGPRGSTRSPRGTLPIERPGLWPEARCNRQRANARRQSMADLVEEKSAAVTDVRVTSKSRSRPRSSRYESRSRHPLTVGHSPRTP